MKRLAKVFFWNLCVRTPPLRHNNFVLTEQVWKKNQRLFRSIVLAIVQNPEDIDDVLQETYRRILNTPWKITDQEETFYYLKKCVRNTSIDWNRKMFRRTLTVKEQVSDYEKLEELQTSSDNPLATLLEKEKKLTDARFIRKVRAAADELPEKQKEAVKSFFCLDGYPSPKQLCTDKNIPYSTLRSRMERGISLIRDKMSQKNKPAFVKNNSETLLKLTEKRSVK